MASLGKTLTRHGCSIYEVVVTRSLKLFVSSLIYHIDMNNSFYIAATGWSLRVSFSILKYQYSLTSCHFMIGIRDFKHFC